jgi:predicted Zn-dependent protease
MRADEWRNADTFEGRQQVDRGTIPINNLENQTVFRLMQQARISAELAAAKYVEFDGSATQLAEVSSLAGYMYVMFAEHYCSGVPFSEFDPVTAAITPGEAVTTAGTYARAVTRFDEALAAAPNYTLARIGKARALMNQGQYAQARRSWRRCPPRSATTWSTRRTRPSRTTACTSSITSTAAGAWPAVRG